MARGRKVSWSTFGGGLGGGYKVPSIGSLGISCRAQPKFTELLYSLRNGWQIRSTTAADQVSFRRDFKFEHQEVKKTLIVTY